MEGWTASSHLSPFLGERINAGRVLVFPLYLRYNAMQCSATQITYYPQSDYRCRETGQGGISGADLR